MSLSLGANIVAALEQGSAWGTAVAVGANDGLALLSFEDSGGQASLPDDTLLSAWGSAPDVGAEAHDLTLSGYLFAGGNCGRLFAYVMGTSGSPSSGGGTDESHTVTLSDSLTDFATIAIRKRASTVKPWEYASAMCQSFTISGSQNERVRWSSTFVANALDRDSSTNTTTQIDAVTIPTIRAVYRHPKATLAINAQGGSALASSDNVQVTDFEVTVRRPLARDFGTAAPSGSATDAVLLPCEDGLSEVTLSFTLRDYSVETWIDAWGAETEYKARLTMPSGYTPSGGAELSWQLSFPRLVLTDQPQAPVTGPGRISHRVNMKGLVAASAPTGMTSITQPIHAVIVDEDSAAYLS